MRISHAKNMPAILSGCSFATKVGFQSIKLLGGDSTPVRRGLDGGVTNAAIGFRLGHENEERVYS